MKRLLLLIPTVFSLFFTNAQLQLGVKGGLNLTTFTGNNAQMAKMRTGFNAGGLAAFSITDMLSVQAEVQYSAQGANYNADSISMSGNINSGYLNIPVLVKYNHSSGFFIETGPQIGLLLSSKAKSGGTSVDVKSSFKSTDFSWVFGLGFLTSANIGIDARYNLGLSNIEKGGMYNTGTLKNSVIQISLFYLFVNQKNSQ
jgi:Outer membrane protein beta-barrel domain